ncbi:retrovirus-related pol polyprotein from transposon TNT 1-94 [Tanacetum coccineum]
MLDRTDFESWQQLIHLYCLGKDNGENIMKSITEGPFQMGTMRDTLTEGGEGALHLGPERARVFADLSAEQKDRHLTLIQPFTDAKDIWDNVKMILEGSELTRMTENLNYTMNLNTSVKSKEKPFIFTMLVSNASVQQYSTQSSKSPQSSNEPSLADNFQLDSGSSSTENLIESLSNSLALLTQSYKSHLPQTNNQLRTSSNARNKATVQDGRVVVQDVRGRYNANNQGRPFQRNNARGNVVAGNVGGQNRGGIINPGQAKPIKFYNCNGLGHIARECPRPM